VIKLESGATTTQVFTDEAEAGFKKSNARAIVENGIKRSNNITPSQPLSSDHQSVTRSL
jgi:hypothetical protein